MTDVAPQDTATPAPVRGSGFDALAGMGTASAENAQTIVREPKIDGQGRAYATGKRKNAIARVWIKPGSGRITISGGDSRRAALVKTRRNLAKNDPAKTAVKPGEMANAKARDITEYFSRPVLRMMIEQPLVVTDRRTQFDVYATVEGSGLSGQAGAIRHAISKALTYYEPGLRPVLKPHGFLTRDSRVVERKKYGRAKARRSFQFSKR